MDEEMDRFTLRLISLVEERPLLYDKSHELYKNRKATANAWDSIGCFLQVPAAIARKTWETERGNIQKYVTKLANPKSGSTVIKPPRLYNYMLFLVPHVKGSKMTSNFVSESLIKEEKSQSNSEPDQSDEPPVKIVKVTHEAFNEACKNAVANMGEILYVSNEIHLEQGELAKIDSTGEQSGDPPPLQSEAEMQTDTSKPLPLWKVPEASVKKYKEKGKEEKAPDMLETAVKDLVECSQNMVKSFSSLAKPSNDKVPDSTPKNEEDTLYANTLVSLLKGVPKENKARCMASLTSEILKFYPDQK